MKIHTLVSANFLVWERLDPRIQQQLLEIYPEGHKPGSRDFYSCLPAGDARSDCLYQILIQAGLKPWRQLNSQTPTEFTFGRARHYDTGEYESFSFLEPMGNPLLHDYIWPTADGTLQVKKSFFKRKRLVDIGNIHSLLVSADIRALLEASSFRGMKFKSVVSQERNAKVELENLWELTTDCRMPPLSDYCTFFDREENPVKGSDTVAYQYFENFYGPPELHYQASAVRDWPWDFALTHELFRYSERRHRRRLVVSKRFNDFCRDNKLKMDWLPVRIDPD